MYCITGLNLKKVKTLYYNKFMNIFLYSLECYFFAWNVP